MKIADSPLDENTDYNISGYTQIAHDDSPYNYLWFIDYDYKFYIVKELETKGGVHHGWEEFTKKEQLGRVLSQGRYDKRIDTATAYIREAYSRGFSKYQYNYIKNRVISILDKEFNNPRIIFYD